jgi:hypothetical protein
MRENEFERKVHEQLEELRIRPSDETWERVQKELREKKKRRAAVLFFLMAGLLLLGYSGYTFLYKSSIQPVAKNSTEQKLAEPASSPVNTETTNNTTTNSTAVAEKPLTTPTFDQKIEKNAVNPALEPEIGKDNIVAVKPAYPERSDQPAIVKTVKEPGTKITDVRQKKNAIGSPKTINTEFPDSNEKEIAANTIDQADKLSGKQPVDKKVGISEKSITANINNENLNSQITVDSASNTDSAVAKTPIEKTDVPVTEEQKPEIARKKNNSKVKFGVEVSGGFVSSSDSPFGIGLGIFSQNKSLDANPPGYSGGVANNPGNTGGTGRVIIPPSDIKPGKGLNLGFIGEMAITKRSSISAGIRYVYFDESLQVGSFRDTAIRSNSYSFAQNFLLERGVRGAYSNSAAQPATPTKYTNRYHFLELPVNFQTRLNKGNKMGILWSAGIAPGYLVSTNAIIYDTTAGGIYFKDERAFKRFHFNVQSGLALQFGNNKRISWSVGPTISLDMTRLMKEDVFTDKRYFLYTGLTGKLFFSPRKK